MGVCNQVTFLILYYITSRLVPLLKVTDAPIQVPNVLGLIVSFKFLNFSSQICLLFVPEMPANFTPYLVQIVYIALASILQTSKGWSLLVPFLKFVLSRDFVSLSGWKAFCLPCGL